MNIALSFPGCHRRGGVERIILECANFLQNRGHELHLYATEYDESALHPSVVRHQVPLNSPFVSRRLATFQRNATGMLNGFAKRGIVHGAFGVVSPPGGVMWVQSVHKTWIQICRRERTLGEQFLQRCNPIHPVLLSMEHDYFGNRQYRKLIALTERVRDELIEHYNTPEQDIVIVPNGYSPTEFNLARARAMRGEMRKSLGYRDDHKVVAFVGNELKRKGFTPLLHAIASLRDPGIHVLVAGRVSSSGVQSLIHRLGMAERVQFTGPSSDVARYYAAADVFAQPTQYEPWGLVILEALACGLPVLTSRLAGASVTIQEGVNGRLLEDPRNVEEVAVKLSALLEGRHASPETIAASVDQYSWDQVLLRYESVLASCAP